MAKNGKRVGTPALGTIVFICSGEGARSVFLAGTFNDWDPAHTAMERQGDGSWKAELELAPGRYEYKFIVDGAWCCDPGRPDAECAGCVPNSFGTMNRVIEVAVADEAKAGAGA